VSKILEFLHKGAVFLGREKRWQVGKVTVYLWPFVALAIFIAILLVYDIWFA